LPNWSLLIFQSYRQACSVGNLEHWSVCEAGELVKRSKL